MPPLVPGRRTGADFNAQTGVAALTGGLSLLGGGFQPTEQERQRLYQEQQGALRGSIGRAQTEARRQAMGAATSASGGGNPFLTQRLGAAAGGDAAQRVQSAGLQQGAQLSAQQTAMEMQARQQQAQATQQRIGGLLGAGGQVLGMAVPAFGALRGAAGATGMAGALGGSGNPVGGLLGSALGAPQQQPQQPPQAPTPQLGFGGGIGTTAPPGMRWDPMTNRWVPA